VAAHFVRPHLTLFRHGHRSRGSDPGRSHDSGAGGSPPHGLPRSRLADCLAVSARNSEKRRRNPGRSSAGDERAHRRQASSAPHCSLSIFQAGVLSSAPAIPKWLQALRLQPPPTCWSPAAPLVSRMRDLRYSAAFFRDLAGPPGPSGSALVWAASPPAGSTFTGSPLSALRQAPAAHSSEESWVLGLLGVLGNAVYGFCHRRTAASVAAAGLCGWGVPRSSWIRWLCPRAGRRAASDPVERRLPPPAAGRCRCLATDVAQGFLPVRAAGSGGGVDHHQHGSASSVDRCGRCPARFDCPAGSLRFTRPLAARALIQPHLTALLVVQAIGFSTRTIAGINRA